jgi:hypothetical protein
MASFLDFIGERQPPGPSAARTGPSARTGEREDSTSFFSRVAGGGGGGGGGGSSSVSNNNAPMLPTTAPAAATGRCDNCVRHEKEKIGLSSTVEALREELVALRRQQATMSGTGDSDKRRADALQEEVVQLRAQVTRLVEVLNAEKAATAERTRAEVDRRMYEESFRYSEISSQLDRARSEVERLNEENRRLRASSGSLSQSAPGTQMGGGGLDLLDVLPGGLELGSLKRSEWRHIFERLVAELARRKRAGKETTSLSHSSFDFKTENIRTEVDQLWDSAARNRRPPPPPPPPPTSYYPPPPTDRRAGADEFLAWSSPSKPSTTPVDQCLASMCSGTAARAPTTDTSYLSAASRPMSATSANDFLRVSSSASKLPSVGGGGGALSSDADAFMGFMNKKF